MRALAVGEFSLLVVGSAIATIGLAALAVYGFRRWSGERILLWLGLFAAPYGVALVLKTSVFQVTFPQPRALWLFGGRLIDFAIIIPALLLFKEFYGEGWRSSVRTLIWLYAVFAVFTFGFIVVRNVPGLIPAPGTGLVLFIPFILSLGYMNGYRAPAVPDRTVLVVGLLAFFVAFSRDHLLNSRSGVWHPGMEPYGFLLLIACLGYVAVRRLAASETELISLNEEMRAATRIQSSILPGETPSLKSLRIAARYAPMSAVAGDFYDFLTIEPECFGILVADVMGHGVPAALVASMVKIAVSTQAENAAEPGRVITGLNSILCRQAQGQYTTAVYLYLNMGQQTGKYCAAGHPAPLLWRSSTQTVHKLEEAGLLLGVRSSEEFAQTEFAFKAGDRLLVYTDGLLEAENSAGQSYGQGSLIGFIEAHQKLGGEQFADRLLSEVLAWPRREGRPSQEDDITFVVVDFLEVQDGFGAKGAV